MMAVNNWTTSTTVNPSTGQTVVTVTVYDPTSRPISVQWASGAPYPVMATSSAPITDSVNLGHADVMAEADAAGVALLALVNAGTAVPGVTMQVNPDPAETALVPLT